MTKTLAQIVSTILALVLMQLSVSCGQGAEAKAKKVKLIEWNANACDNTYDPDLLVNRITGIRVQDGITFLTINFTENCCATFKPQISFKDNKLFLMPYKKYSGDYCACNCCFSIEYKIEGLPGSGYEIYFQGKNVETSSDHYKVVQPTGEVYKGNSINRTNRYGFKEGLWMTFYEDGKIKTQEKYPESELYHERRPQWEKSFYPSGRLSHFSRKDTTEAWFEDGTLKDEFIHHTIGDTTYRKVFSRYENRQVHERSLSKDYPTVFLSEFDPKYKSEGSTGKIMYSEEYFENGQLKYRFGRDTTYTWHASGKIASREFTDGKIEYDENGFVFERAFHWRSKGSAFSGDLNHSLYATIGRNGKVSKIHYVRDQPVPDGIAPNVHYNWAWNDTGKLTQSPEKWKEPFPWVKFSKLIMP
jgi:YD repeat-containing protein